MTTDSSRLTKVARGRPDKITILELGCGRVVPALGLVSHLLDSGYRGSIHMILQDLDPATIDSVTKVSTEQALNQLPSDLRALVSTEYIAVSWDEFRSCDHNVDVVLSSECVYRSDLFESHAGVIARSLSPSGVAIIAAKRHYFGCGGGTIDFADFIDNSSFGLKSELVQVFENGMSNTREILEVFSIPI